MSYYEQVQNASNDVWELEYVLNRLESAMRSATKEVIRTSEEKGINMRHAAYSLAFERIESAMLAKGMISIE